MPKFYEVTNDGESNFFNSKEEAIREAKAIAQVPGYCIVTVDKIKISNPTRDVVLAILNQRGYVLSRDCILKLEEEINSYEA